MAFAVMDTLRSELGLSIPKDASVIGYDDVPASAWPAYSQTIGKPNGPRDRSDID